TFRKSPRRSQWHRSVERCCPSCSLAGFVVSKRQFRLTLGSQQLLRRDELGYPGIHGGRYTDISFYPRMRRRTIPTRGVYPARFGRIVVVCAYVAGNASPTIWVPLRRLKTRASIAADRSK